MGPPQTLPSAAGRLLEKEVDVLLGLRQNPKRPFAAVLGGAKVSDKLGVIEALLDVVDTLVVGGGMCFTFLAAQGHSVGDSLLEEDQIETCRALLERTDASHLPSDLTALGPGEEVRQAGVDLPSGWKGLDIGPGTAAEPSHGAAATRMCCPLPARWWPSRRRRSGGRTPSARAGRWPR